MFSKHRLASGPGWGCGKFDGQWGIERSDGAKWTEDDRIRTLGEMCMRLKNILEKAKVQHVDQIVGIPVEVSFDGMTLKEWRVLEEVL